MFLVVVCLIVSGVSVTYSRDLIVHNMQTFYILSNIYIIMLSVFTFQYFHVLVSGIGVYERQQ